MGLAKKTLSLLPLVGTVIIGLTAAMASAPELSEWLPELLIASERSQTAALDSLDEDSNPLPYPIEPGNGLSEETAPNPFDLQPTQEYEYDPVTGTYQPVVNGASGGSGIAPQFTPNTVPTLSFEEFWDLQEGEILSEQWIENANNQATGLGSSSSGRGFRSPIGVTTEIPKLELPEDFASDIFGPGGVDIRPSGGIDMEFGFTQQKIDNPSLPSYLQRPPPNFLFDMNINMSVVGKIGDKLSIGTNYNTKTTFDFENQLRLEYTGDEDDIIQKLEAGDISFPLPTTLIPGSQSLFGLKAQLKFGRLTVTSVISQQESKADNIQIENGAQVQEFEIQADQFEENRHFFLSQYFYDNYDAAMATLPYVNSQVNITNIEVWVTNRNGSTLQTRSVIALSDLGESSPNSIHVQSLTSEEFPRNNSNDLYRRIAGDANNRLDNLIVGNLEQDLLLRNTEDFRLTEARKLNPNEYTYDAQLGYVSLNATLQTTDVLGVAYEYTNIWGETFKVGEFAQDLPPNVNNNGKEQVLLVKMLKSVDQRPDLPIWKLMMRNVYNLNAYQLNGDDFRLDVYYETPGGGITRFLPKGESVRGQLLIRLLNLDRLNAQNDPYPDGIFDFIEGYTIVPRRGRLIFPVVEPFGSSLRSSFSDDEQHIADQYVYQQLYDTTRIAAQQFPELNRFVIKGEYKSSVSSEFSLNAFNIPQGSITVTAGGARLVEGTDYTVNYSLGRVTVINDAYLNSGIPINIAFEDPALFSLQKKTFFGTRLDYWIHDDFTLGGTYVHLSQRPFTPKVNYGDDAISNRMVGLDMNYFRESDWITRTVDKLPFYSTKEKSSVTFNAEGAKFIPGHAGAIDLDSGGQVFIDDFEGTQSQISLEFPLERWTLASTPRTDDFPEATLLNDLSYGRNRANFSWYKIDPQIYGQSIGEQTHYTRQVRYSEVLPERSIQTGGIQVDRLRTFDLAYNPLQRGPYNFDTNITNEGELREPENRWGGMMRELDINDFQLSNIEFVEFWMLDPFLEAENQDDRGEMYLNLGTVSEDVLADGRKSFENGLPTPGAPENTDTTVWARISKNNVISNFFDSDPINREAQDVGFDGVDDDGERLLFKEYLDALTGIPNLDPAVLAAAQADPANDNFRFFVDDVFPENTSVLDRYSRYSHPQGNSVLADGNTFSSSTNLPDNEDLNQDNSLEQSESFFQYKIDLEPNMTVGENFITDRRVVEVDNYDTPAVWYKFQIPVNEFSDAIGGISGFTSIRFVRMYMTKFQKPVTVRLAEFNLVRNQWRKYNKCIVEDGEYQPDDNGADADFNVTAVSVEQNSNRDPINYVLPPGVIRQQLFTGNSSIPLLQNEQSLSIQVCDLEDGIGKGVFKLERYDMRPFKRLKLQLHAEARGNQADLQNGDVAAVVRIGSDLEFNYYEIEIPLVATPLDITNDPEQIWPDANSLDIALQDLVDLKKIRNYTIPGDVNYEKPFSKFVQDTITGLQRKLTLVGSPDLGKVRTIFLGVRNPKRNAINKDRDDGQSKCAEVWFNELALAEFDERGGYAAIARLDVKLADLGNVAVTGNMHTAGFGTLEQRVNDRFKDNLLEYDATANLNLDKFLPKDSGLKIPLYAGYSESISTPQFEPYNTDVVLNEALDSLQLYKGQEARDSLKRQSQTYQSIKSVNISNARKVRTNREKPQRFYDLENFNVTAAFTETNYRDPVIASENEKRYRAAIGYAFSARPKYMTPLKGLVKSNSKYLSLLKDFNLNFVPSSVSFQTEVNRLLVRTELRNLTNEEFDIPAAWNKDFTWSRNYGFKWNPTRSITTDFTASNLSRIEEFGGEPTEESRARMWESFKNFGRTLNYNQNANVSYNLPLNKFPLLDWTTVRTRYGTTYDWVTGPLFLFPEIDTGNTISNGRNIQFNGELNFTKLYNKSKKLKGLDRRRTNRNTKDKKKEKGEEPKDKEGEQEKVKKKRKPGELSKGARIVLRPLLMLKRASIDYRISRGTEIPGWTPRSQLLGNNWENGAAPGLDFIFGMQPDHAWLVSAAQAGWITDNPNLNRMVRQTYTKDLTGKATLEPVKDLKIDLTMTQRYTETHSELFKVDKFGEFNSLAPLDMGSYTASYLPIKTLFSAVDDTTNLTETYLEFESNRQVISERLAQENFAATGVYFNPADSTFVDEFFRGYGPYSQDVLIPAFIAAYSGSDANTVKLDNALQVFPLPNWSITYNGLSKLPGMRSIFSSFTLNHRYSSTYTVNSFRSEPNFDGQYYDANPEYYAPNVLDTLSGNFLPLVRIPDVQISEQLSPLIGVDMAFRNGMTAKMEWKKTRTVGISFVDYQLNETRSGELVLGVGFKLTGLKLPFKNSEGKNVVLENDMNFKMDFSIRDNQTFVTGFDQEIAQPTTGSKTIRISPTIDYVVNDRVRLMLFYDRTRTIPYTSQSYPITNSKGGIRVSFSLAN